jgi:dTDP-4-dehydrorhamnose 3,5-epimerase
MGIKVTKTALDGVLIIDTEFFRDDRGFFIESYHRERFVEKGVSEVFVQDNHSRSSARVLRGFHYQDLTAPMVKLIRCTAGRILDVAVDLRAGSPTFGKTVAVELGPDTMRQLLVPIGFGHAFLTLSDAAEVQYKCSNVYTPASEGGVAWNDPDIDIAWPVTEPLLSARDKTSVSLKQYLEKPAFVYGHGR